MDRIDFLGFVLLLRDISRLDRYSTQQSKQIYKKENCGFSQEEIRLPSPDRSRGRYCLSPLYFSWKFVFVIDTGVSRRNRSIGQKCSMCEWYVVVFSILCSQSQIEMS